MKGTVMAESIEVKLKEGSVYWTVDKTAILIHCVDIDNSWGISGELLSGEYRGLRDTWTDDMYPYRVSFDVDDNGLSLTHDEVPRDEYPEYYL